MELPAGKRAERDRPEDYLADPGLVDAVNVALLLEQPLLLNWRAGNRQDATRLELGLELRPGAPLKFETKSTSTAGDLFYTYNALARFHAWQTAEVLLDG